MTLMTGEDIQQAARFSFARRGGYAEAEVDAFVAQAQATIVDLRRRLAESESACEHLKARVAAPAPADGAEQVPARALRLLELAQQSADAAITDAQHFADQLLAEAGERAAAREEAAREAALAIERATQERQAQLQSDTANLLEAEQAARLQVHELTRRLTVLLEQYRHDEPAQQ